MSKELIPKAMNINRLTQPYAYNKHHTPTASMSTLQMNQIVPVTQAQSVVNSASNAQARTPQSFSNGTVVTRTVNFNKLQIELRDKNRNGAQIFEIGAKTISLLGGVPSFAGLMKRIRKRMTVLQDARASDPSRFTFQHKAEYQTLHRVYDNCEHLSNYQELAQQCGQMIAAAKATGNKEMLRLAIKQRDNINAKICMGVTNVFGAANDYFDNHGQGRLGCNGSGQFCTIEAPVNDVKDEEVDTIANDNEKVKDKKIKQMVEDLISSYFPDTKAMFSHVVDSCNEFIAVCLLILQPFAIAPVM